MKKLVIGITSPISVILIQGQIRYFANLGYTVYLMAPAHPDVAEICEKEGATHLAVNFRRDISVIHDLFAMLRVYLLLKKVNPQIINFGTPKAALLGMIAAGFLAIPKRVYTCRGFRFEHERGLKRRILVGMEKVTAHFATDVICISESIRSMAVTQQIFNGEKCRIIGQGSSNGIDLSSFSRMNVDPKQSASDKQRLGITGHFVYGFVGRLIDRKGVNELVSAFKRLQTKHSDISLLIVGHPEMDQLSDAKIIEEIMGNSGIVSVGWQTDVPRYLSLMDVFVLPAWWEGFGNVLIQAAAMGIPVISTQATGTQDAVSNGFNGILVPPKNVDKLEEAMDRYYSDEILREAHGQNGCQWATRFASDAIWNGIESIYNG